MRPESPEQRPPGTRGHGPELDQEGMGEARCCLTLRTLGSARLVDANGVELTAVLAQPKRFALLVYLSLAWPRTFHRRDTLLTLFWPELDERRARNALSQSLSFLRAHLPDGVIVTRGTGEVGVCHECVRTGVETFDAALEEERWADALEAYQGDFLRGFHVSIAPGFEEWMEGERIRLRTAAAKAAWSLAREQARRGALFEARSTAQRALDLVATDECPVRDFIEVLSKAGDRAAALAFYRSFSQRLWRDLDLEPSEQTQALVEAIREGGFEEREVPMAGPGLQKPEEGEAADSFPGPALVRPEVVEEAEPQPEGVRREGPLLTEPRAGGGWRKGPGLWLFPAGGIAVLAGLFVLSGRRSPEPVGPPPADRPFTVLAEVQGSADPGEREAVAFLFRTALDVSHVVQTVPEPEVARTLALMDLAEESPLDAAAVRVVGARLGVPTVVIPRLDRLGETYSLAVRVEDADSGHLRVAVQGRAGAAGGVVSLVDSVVVELRRELGESEGVLARTEPLPQVLTPSLEALKSYQLAREAGAGRARVAIDHLREAVRADTAFAMAWQLMASFYGNYLNQPDSAEQARRQAERFGDRLSEARRADLELHRRMREDVALWDMALEDAERAVLRDPRYLNNYGVYIALPGGLPDSSLNIRFRLERDGAEAAHRFHPEEPYSTRCFINTHYLAAALDRMDEWRALLDTLDMELPPECGREAALFESLAAGEWDRVDSMVLHSPGDWRWPTAVEVALLQMVPLRGRIRAAHVVPTPDHPETRALRPDSSALTNIAHLLLQLAYGLPLEEAPEETYARRGAPRELEGRGWDAVTDFVLYGVRESLLGDTLESQRVSKRLRAMRDSATSRTFEAAFAPWFALLAVGPAYQREDWRRVIETLEPMASRIHEPKVGHLGGDDYLVWLLLAEAHDGLGDGSSAAEYLELILERPRARRENWLLQGYIHPAARFKLAGLYAEAGDAERAWEHYRVFLDTFTDPEPEFRWMVDEARRGLTHSGG